jgi:hypothetical protein
VTTRYVYRTTITVTVNMADAGDEHSEGDVQPEWGPGEQAESAREWAEQALPLTQTYEEPWVTIDAPPLTLVKTEPAEGGKC